MRPHRPASRALRLIFFGALAAAAASGGCGRKKTAVSTRLPTGDVVWFEDGAADGAGETEAALARGGFVSVFLPATTIVREGDRWSTVPAEPPAHPFDRVPVTLVITAGEAAKTALGEPAGALAAADAAGLAAKSALRDASRFGKVRGVHLDIPFAAANAEAYGALLRNVRGKVPPEMLLTATLRFAPSGPEQEALEKALAPLDGQVAVVFGEGAVADPAATDRLARPWLAAYAPGARGRWTSAKGEERQVGEGVLASLTDDPRVEFSHDLSLRDESASGFLLTPHESFSMGPLAFHANDRVRFRQPSLSDMVYRFGADLAGKRFVKGRAVILPGRAETSRIFTLAALDDILLGRPLNTDLRVTIEPSRGVVAVGAENPTAHASLVSRTSNWVEVEVPWGGISDVRAGGFDRFEVFGVDGGAVTLGRATRIRFFETLVSPGEKIEPAKILVRRPPPKDCCAHRVHVLSSAGAEVTREGDGPPTTPPASPK